MSNKEIKVTGKIISGAVTPVAPVSSGSKEAPSVKVSVPMYEPISAQVNEARATVRLENLGVHVSGFFRRGMDSASTGEASKIALETAREDTGKLDATLHYYAAKQPYSESILQDTHVMSWEALRAFSEEAGAIDPLSLQMGRPLLEALQGESLLDWSLVKPLDDQPNTQEELTFLFAYVRDFDSSLSATDDFWGAANLDDDQTAVFGKSLSDSSFLPDLLQLTFDRPLLSASTSEEIVALFPQLVQDDSSSGVDELIHDLDKLLLEQPSSVVELNWAVSKQFAEELTAIDTSLAKPFRDHPSFSSGAALDETHSSFGARRAEKTRADDLLALSLDQETLLEMGHPISATFIKASPVVDDIAGPVGAGRLSLQSYTMSDYVTPGYTGSESYF